MVRCEKEITPEQYRRAIKNGGMIAHCDRNSIFTDSELYGYGIYLPKVHKGADGKCYCSYSRGESCD